MELEPPDEAVECPVRADPESMRQLILNLLGNALAATPESGRIEVRVSREQENAILEIEDSGKGIAPEDLPRVFDPFFSRSDGGTGLGLSVVHGIVKSHQGAITVSSEPEQGTTVEIYLPLAQSHQTQTEPRQAAE